MNAKTMFGILTSLVMLAGTACGAADGTSAEADTSVQEDTLSAKTFTADSSNVKLLGRNYLADDGTLWVVHSASGVEFSFMGTKASVTIVGDSGAGTAQNSGNEARFAVYVNGKLTMDELVTEPEKTYEIFSSDAEAETVVRIIKLSGSANSTFGIKSIDAECTGGIQPTAPKDLKIEFIGDSITCGYGVDDEVKEHHFSTATENATKTYAFKTAENLDADWSFVSFSGHGIISGYTDNGQKQTQQTVPPYYAKLGRSYGSKSGDFLVQDKDWDFNSFVPDVIVINLGTNDDSYCKGDDEKAMEYAETYEQFIEEVRSHNSDAQIICTLGIMGDRLYPFIEYAVSEYTEKTGDTKVSAMKFDVQNQADGYAADWHPTEATHEKAAQKLTDEIKSILGLS